ncbi:hypothetical protein AWC38_SpisGene7678 [Stylophora pistillata]|uniref:Uncharacterized protein n=1 Tax=Stylophora pistillata TaxID=50429 RepID=A0A2B4SAB6_STYPI|nr:hypothetical protein AWC38_SpisGene7678 [Stylophora pistillata]
MALLMNLEIERVISAVAKTSTTPIAIRRTEAAFGPTFLNSGQSEYTTSPNHQTIFIFPTSTSIYSKTLALTGGRSYVSCANNFMQFVNFALK